MIHIDTILIILGPISPGLSYLHDLGDDEDPEDGCRAFTARPQDPLERFIWDLDDLAIMNCPDISASLDDLPVQQSCYIICNNWCMCLGGTCTNLKERRPYCFYQEQRQHAPKAHACSFQLHALSWEELHQFLLGLYGELILPANLYPYTQVLRDPAMYNTLDSPVVTEAMLRGVWTHIGGRLRSWIIVKRVVSKFWQVTAS
jgi:hypothetical protein